MPLMWKGDEFTAGLIGSLASELPKTVSREGEAMRKPRKTDRNRDSRQVVDVSAGAMKAMTDVGRQAADAAPPAMRQSVRTAGEVAAGAIEGSVDAARQIAQAAGAYQWPPCSVLLRA